MDTNRSLVDRRPAAQLPVRHRDRVGDQERQARRDAARTPTYTGITPEFWGACDAVCGEADWVMWGTPNCGKGQPGQSRPHRPRRRPGPLPQRPGRASCDDRRLRGGRPSGRRSSARWPAATGDEAEALVLGRTFALTRFANNAIHQNVVEASAHLRVRVAVGTRVASRLDQSPRRRRRRRRGPAGERAGARRARESPLGRAPGRRPRARRRRLRRVHRDRHAPCARAQAAGVLCRAAAAAGLQAAGFVSTAVNEVAVASTRGTRAYHAGTVAEAQAVARGATRLGLRRPGPRRPGPDRRRGGRAPRRSAPPGAPRTRGTARRGRTRSSSRPTRWPTWWSSSAASSPGSRSRRGARSSAAGSAAG